MARAGEAEDKEAMETVDGVKTLYPLRVLRQNACERTSLVRLVGQLVACVDHRLMLALSVAHALRPSTQHHNTTQPNLSHKRHHSVSALLRSSNSVRFLRFSAKSLGKKRVATSHPTNLPLFCLTLPHLTVSTRSSAERDATQEA